LTAGLGFDEIIVVDGGSIDQTCTRVGSAVSSTQSSVLSSPSPETPPSTSSDLEVVKERQSKGSTIRLLSAPPSRARQFNVGAGAARGDVLLFLHADTHLPPSARSSIEAALADGPTVGGRFDVQFDIPSVWGYLISGLMNIRSRLTRISTGDQALFVRRQVFEQLGGFADIPLMEDVEFSTRLKRRGTTSALRDRVTTSFRRWKQHGPLKTILLMWTLRLLYWIGISPLRLSRLYPSAR
jgi:rSAM/selenodomain-associated transferase 2